MGLTALRCGIFAGQGSNPCPLHWQADSQPLDHQGGYSRLKMRFPILLCDTVAYSAFHPRALDPATSASWSTLWCTDAHASGDTRNPDSRLLQALRAESGRLNPPPVLCMDYEIQIASFCDSSSKLNALILHLKLTLHNVSGKVRTNHSNF